MTNTLSLKNRKFRENWLLLIAMATFIVFSLLLIFIVDIDKFLNSSRFGFLDIKLNVLVVFAVFIAPLLEEFSFRASFCKSKFLKIIATVILTAYVIITGANNYAVYVVFVIYIIIYSIVSFRDVPLLKKSTYALNSILFGVIHYKLTDLNNIHTASQVLFHCGLGFILLWIFFNFKLVGSVLAHVSYNGVLIFVMLYNLTNPIKNLEYFKNETASVEFNKTDFDLYDQGNIRVYEDSVICVNCLPLDILKYNTKGYKVANYEPAESFVRYDIKVYSKSINFIDDNKAFDVLIESGLLRETGINN
jgi:hypothetical protein